MDTSEEKIEAVDILDTQARTRERFGKGPFNTQTIGREALKRWVLPLADHLARTKPPKGLETVIRKLSRKQLALLALSALLNQINLGWDTRGKKRKRKVKNPDAMFRLELGRAVRDELEFAGLLRGGAGKKWVNPGKNRVERQIRLGKLYKLEWKNRECARVGDWLWDGLAAMSCFDADERGFPKIADNHKQALDELAEELVFKHPLYMPSLMEPPPWTSWRTQYDDKISATFVKANDPQTIEAVKAAFANGSIELHAMGVSAVQRTPLRINPVAMRLLREFCPEENRRDLVVAEELGGNVFWNLIRCDRRGRFIHLCDFNYTRGDPVRSLFNFAEGRPIKNSIAWLEIAVANAKGVGGTWRQRNQWVAEHREEIKAIAANPTIALLQSGNDRAKEPYLYAVACAEYVAADIGGPEYPTHLPIWLDATSNGLQHLAMMRRDRRLAEMVNLNTCTDGDILYFEKTDGNLLEVSHLMDAIGLPAGLVSQAWIAQREREIQDIYKRVADRVETNLLADRHDPISRVLLEHKSHLRNLCKEPVMTLMYGVTKPGMLDQIIERAEKDGLILPPGAALRLRDHVWKAIGETLSPAIETREFIQNIAEHRLPDALEWTTPSGFPVANRYLKPRMSTKDRVVLPFLGQKVIIADEYTDKPRRKKTINSAVANFAHSLDAAHLVRSVNSAAAQGIANILTVHDCYATLAPDTALFAKIRRFEFAEMYRNNPLVDLWRRNVAPGPNELTLIEMGDLNPFMVTFSEYSDR
jgi:hypothetical protein